MISKKKSTMSEFSQHQTIFVLFSFVISFTIIDKVAGSSFDLNADVKFLTDANFDDYAVASILLYRTPDQRKQINDAVGKARNDDKLIDEQTLEEVLNSEPLTNLWCTMFFDETALLASFFGEYFCRKDEISMAVVLIQVKDMDNFMKVYKEQYEAGNFEARCQDQSELFKKLLKVWTEKSREPDPSGDVNHDDVMKDVEALKAEQPNWNTKTTQLEVILIKKTFQIWLSCHRRI
ncbi:uncharacterized protein LOC135848249 [Planococcus citri]|uniref:uncharacterized protein LOC135848249 n=1 Tax=Planococcus citri TaxID=170843 RepID=UPI0031F9E163